MNFWEANIYEWIFGVIGFLCSSGIIIFIALFYDHRRNPSVAIKYLVGFVSLMIIGLTGVFIFNMLFVILIPFLLFGMLIIKKVLDHKPNKNETIEKLN